jgi:hypothetical protein
VSLFVGVPVEAEGLLSIRLVGHDGPRATAFQPSPQRSTVVGFVAEKLAGCSGTTDEARSGWTVMRFAATQEDGKKTAFSICDCVDLRIAPAT